MRFLDNGDQKSKHNTRIQRDIPLHWTGKLGYKLFIVVKVSKIQISTN